VETSLLTEEHFQGILGSMYTLPLKIIYAGRAKKVTDGVFIANSNYTATEILKLYRSLQRNRVRVIYPPCRIHDHPGGGKRDLDFVSLGSFVSDKRQLEQLKIARSLRDHNFTLIGGLKSRRYFRKCEDFIEKHRLSNVKLCPDASRETVGNLLSRSKVFLHTKRNEHFGVSTVESISHGCLPLVHDSGGSREIVPIGGLRFQNTEEAIHLSRKLLSLRGGERRRLSSVLRENTERYGLKAFRAAMGQILFGDTIS
jgi:glycosyltransferase involved in cell wall biosynthesis